VSFLLLDIDIIENCILATDSPGSLTGLSWLNELYGLSGLLWYQWLLWKKKMIGKLDYYGHTVILYN